MKHWHAIYTRSGSEFQVSALLQQRGVETYVPSVRRKVLRRDRPDRIAYFPCYLFARLDFDRTRLSSVAWMPGVRRIVCNGDVPAPVSDHLVELIRDRLEGMDEHACDGLRRGDRVRISAGPLRDLDAVFEQHLSAADRVRVLLDVMGRVMPVDLDRSQVQRTGGRSSASRQRAF